MPNNDRAIPDIEESIMKDLLAITSSLCSSKNGNSFASKTSELIVMDVIECVSTQGKSSSNRISTNVVPEGDRFDRRSGSCIIELDAITTTR